MVISKEYNFIHIIGFSLLCLTLWTLPIVTMAETDTDSFYGGQSLNSIVDGEKMTLTLPGGVKVAMENQETAYTLPDHTQSTRLAVEADNTVSKPITYTPFGDNQTTGDTSLTESYTGQTFELETATYDYHARRYDPTVARFTSVDVARESISSYSYVDNNPINKIDPDGLRPISLILYSVFGTVMDDQSLPGIGGENVRSRPHLAGSVAQFFRNAFSPNPTEPLVTGGFLDGVASPPLGINQIFPEEVRHLTISAHGDGSRMQVHMSRNNSDIVDFSPERFADYMHRNLNWRHPKAIEEIRSIFLDRWGIGGETLNPTYRSTDDIMARGFSSRAFQIFPSLRQVIVSNYNIETQIYGDDAYLRIFGINSPNNEVILKVNARNYLAGDFPPELFEPLSHRNVHQVLENGSEPSTFSNVLNPDTGISGSVGIEPSEYGERYLYPLHEFEARRRIATNRFLSEGGFTKPLLTKFLRE